MSKMSPSIISPYIANSEGILVPNLPNSCTKAKDGENCMIVIFSWRYRKTGPSFPLAIIHCKIHGCYTTIYPPGYVRYQRKLLVDVSSSGKQFIASADEVSSSLSCFQKTKFEAALDAADGRPWDRAPYSTSGKWWQTQCRHLNECCRLLGIYPGQGENKRCETFAHILNVPQIVLKQEKARIASNPGYRTRGKGVVTILQKMTGNCLVERLSLAGHVAGLWGRPFWWQDDIGQLSPVPFQRPGTSSMELFNEALVYQ